MVLGVATGVWCNARLCPFANSAPRRPADSVNWGGHRPGWHAVDINLNLTIDVLHCDMDDDEDLIWMYELNSTAGNHTRVRQYRHKYYLGKTLLMSDTIDLYHMFNLSRCLRCTPPLCQCSHSSYSSPQRS